MSNTKFKIQNDAGTYFWTSMSTNGKIIGESIRTFSRRIDALANAHRHGMDNNPNQIGQTDKWKFNRDESGQYQWVRTASNGTLVGASKTFSRRIDCVKNAQNFGYAV